LSGGHGIIGIVRADEYRRAVKNLTDFLLAFDRLMLDLEPTFDHGRFPRWKPKPDRRSHADQLVGEVASLAGPAAEAFEASGIWMDYKPPGTGQTQPVNPALAWSTIFDPMPMFDPHLMAIVGQQALGWLEHKRDEQAARQRGFIGAVAWFFTLAPRVREAAGLSAQSAPGHVVTWITVIAQGLIVTVIGGALVYPVASALGWSL
jgi:hypothetical protein